MKIYQEFDAVSEDLFDLYEYEEADVLRDRKIFKERYGMTCEEWIQSHQNSYNTNGECLNSQGIRNICEDAITSEARFLELKD
jgi:hypothetical protein